jgi:hypothetical protein
VSEAFPAEGTQQFDDQCLRLPENSHYRPGYRVNHISLQGLFRKRNRGENGFTRQARMSLQNLLNRLSRGQFSRISSTAIRVPAMTGLPIMMLGLETIHRFSICFSLAPPTVCFVLYLATRQFESRTRIYTGFIEAQMKPVPSVPIRAS